MTVKPKNKPSQSRISNARDMRFTALPDMQHPPRVNHHPDMPRKASMGAMAGNHHVKGPWHINANPRPYRDTRLHRLGDPARLHRADALMRRKGNPQLPLEHNANKPPAIPAAAIAPTINERHTDAIGPPDHA
jgi:hypothetical protein